MVLISSYLPHRLAGSPVRLRHNSIVMNRARMASWWDNASKAVGKTVHYACYKRDMNTNGRSVWHAYNM
jgi:hypothetical protein